MKTATAARLLRLYPECWRERYGEEFTALLEEHPKSLKTLLDVLRAALEIRMDTLRLGQRNPAALGGVIWWAWMAAVAAGIILYGMVDDSPFVPAMQSSALFRACWLGIEIGSVVAGAAIAWGGAVVGWSILRQAFTSHRRDILWRLAFPVVAHGVVFGWIVAIMIWTDGHWAPSPWAVSFQEPGWPSPVFRWVTGSISAALWLAALVGSGVSIVQALRLSQPATRAVRFAARLAPIAAAGILIMFVSALLWGFTASRDAARAFQEHVGPLGLTSSSGWLISVILFGAGALFSTRAAWRSMRLGLDRD